MMTPPRIRIAAAALWIPLSYAIGVWFVQHLPTDASQRALAVVALMGAAISLGGGEAARITQSYRPYVPVTYLGLAFAAAAMLGYLVTLLFAGHDGWFTLAAPLAFSLLAAAVVRTRANEAATPVDQESIGLPSSSSRTP